MKRPCYINLRTGGPVPWAYNLLELGFACEGENFSAKVRCAPEGVDPDVDIDLEAHNRDGQPLSRVVKDLNRWLDRQAKLHSADALVPVSWQAGFEQMWLRRCEYIASMDIGHLVWEEHLDLRSICVANGLRSTSTDWDIVDSLQAETGDDNVSVQMDSPLSVVRALAIIGEGYLLADALAS